MTPGVFEYHRPNTVEEALALLGQFGEDGKVLAGGHSLVPMMKLRLAEPAHLIDINAIDGLRGIRDEGDVIVIGAGTTQAEVLTSDLLAKKCPILPEAAAQIADPQVRNCGTIGGNCANGDPGNDDPAIMMALDASYTLQSQDGERQIAAREFYQGIYTTALADNELLTEVRIPTPAEGVGMSYQKIKRKVGDYAIAAAAVTLSMSNGQCTDAAIALTNVGDTALLPLAAADAIKGTSVDASAVDAAAEAAMAASEPVEDLRGTREYRTAMAGQMTRQAIVEALSRAAGS
ncbi:MAG: xanthine dehydrogenase family protein subunit M [Alphaproteobacteria bacterium]|nr:xanthine dehydrogenase family protein subunit M [Alphaproteobacteria bacterium]MCZ6841086.1 xanthine dehydrogenase family protein subunit M [Alphaproteobacteria bacterium]